MIIQLKHSKTDRCATSAVITAAFLQDTKLNSQFDKMIKKCPLISEDLDGGRGKAGAAKSSLTFTFYVQDRPTESPSNNQRLDKKRKGKCKCFSSEGDLLPEGC